MRTVLLVAGALALWTALSFPLAVIVGRMFAFGARGPADHRVQERRYDRP